jgi:exopolyphosphatase / guanosine-5'-triphosphate,3'-diphosphate pyrophosphatase
VAARTVRTRAALMTCRVAAVDCGTNSLRLLVADVDLVGAELTDVARRMEIVRLGQGVDQTGRLASAALARTADVLRDYADVIAATAARSVRMVATSATRDASNTAEFTRQVKEILGVAPEVLTGSEEALLSFTGGTAELAAAGDSGPFLVVDIGGGSTEFVLGNVVSRGDGPPRAISVNIGCVRMTERHLHGDPPTSAELAAATADIDAALDAVTGAVPVRQARTLIGLAGSVTTVAGIAMGLPAYDAARIHHARVCSADVHEVARSLLAQTRATRAAIGVMHPGRVDVIGGGALILDRIMQRFGFSEVLVSEHDILDGIAWSLARESRGAVKGERGGGWGPEGEP